MTTRFTVEGRGQFPFDMLRYDCCYPDSSVDAGKMEHHVRERREITLLTNNASAPTEDRWSSFLWTVTGHDKS